MEQKETDNAWYLELLTPTGTPVQMEDDTTKGTRASPESEKSPATGTQGMHRREAYCLLVRVAHNVDSVSALDAKVPDYVWTEAIARDICVYQIGAPPNTFVVEPLSDTEFLLFQGPWSGPGMAWEDTILYIRTLHDIQDWGGMEVTVIAGQCTMRQSRIDLANTREYRRAQILGRLTVVEKPGKVLSSGYPQASITTGSRSRLYPEGQLLLCSKSGWSPSIGADAECHETSNPGRLPLCPGTFWIWIRKWRIGRDRYRFYGILLHGYYHFPSQYGWYSMQ